jgi:hypothetical protein
MAHPSRKEKCTLFDREQFVKNKEVREPAPGRLLKNPRRLFRSGKGADLVLFQMEVLACMDSDPDLVSSLEVLEEMALLVAQKIGHARVNLNHDPVPGQVSVIPFDLSKNFVADGLRGLEISFALAVEARLAENAGQAFLGSFSGHFD